MSDPADRSKVFLQSGVGRNPPGSCEDPLHRPASDAIHDLAICPRVATPNRNLGYADEYLAAGEWGLALDETEAVLQTDELDRFSAAALKRARILNSMEDATMPEQRPMDTRPDRRRLAAATGALLLLAACAPRATAPVPDPQGYRVTDAPVPFAVTRLLPRGVNVRDVRVNANCYGYAYQGTVYPVLIPRGTQYCL